MKIATMLQTIEAEPTRVFTLGELIALFDSTANQAVNWLIKTGQVTRVSRGRYTANRSRVPLAPRRFEIPDLPRGDGDAAEVLCWCMWKTMMVPWPMIRAGQTLSCGDDRCNASLWPKTNGA